MPEEFTQANVNLTDEDARMMDQMMTEDGYEKRSPFVRWLIRQEYARRYSKPNPLVTVADAQAASGTGDRLVAQDALSAPEGR